MGKIRLAFAGFGVAIGGSGGVALLNHEGLFNSIGNIIAGAFLVAVAVFLIGD